MMDALNEVQAERMPGALMLLVSVVCGIQAETCHRLLISLLAGSGFMARLEGD